MSSIYHSSKLLSFPENRIFAFWHQRPRWRISAILDFTGPITGSLKSPGMTSYRSSIDTVALNCLVFEKIAFLHFGITIQDGGSLPSWILGSNNGFFEKPIVQHMTSYRSSIETIALLLNFWENHLFAFVASGYLIIAIQLILQVFLCNQAVMQLSLSPKYLMCKLCVLMEQGSC